VKELTNYFARPEFLWVLLLALPLAAGLFYWSWRVKQKLIGQFVQARLLPTLTVGLSPARQKLRLALLLAALAGVLAALAGPRWGFSWEEARQRGLDIVVAVDTSRSMLARDAQPNRLEKAKRAAFDLMRLAKEDRLGVVAFAGGAFLQCPLTVDDEAFRQNLDALQVGVIPQGGTALSEAIHAALGAFAPGNNNHKALVLFTDGEDHDEDSQTMGAAQEAADAGLRIFTVGVGTAAGELLQVTDDKGNTSFIKDQDGNVVKSHLNEDLLRRIAGATGGFYLPLVGANPMEILYGQGLAPLPKSEATVKLTRVYRERYHWFLGFAVLCLAAEMLLPEGPRPRRAEPAAASASVRRTAAGIPFSGGRQSAATRPSASAERTAAVILGLLLVPAPAPASGPGAFRDYQSGDYQSAYEEYNRLSGEKTNDYRLHYNAGTSAYKAKDLDAAEQHLGAALNSPEIISDLQAQEHAYYNLGNTLYHLGEPADDPKKKQERWEQSIANYSRALQLDTNDLDAKNNLAFVKKKLEELKQQQQQQQNNQKNDDKNQDQKNQDQKNQQNQQGQDQKNQQDQQQQSSPQDQQDKKDQQNQAQQQKDQQQNPSQQAKSANDGQRGKEPGQDQQTASAAPAQMSLQQAQQLLDAQKDDEKALIFSAENTPAKPAAGKTVKDW
jgi:Ca-activated chloride channel family protein